MPEEPLAPEREALLAVAEAGGDVVDAGIRIIGVMEMECEHLGEIARSLAQISQRLSDLTQVVETVGRRF